MLSDDFRRDNIAGPHGMLDKYFIRMQSFAKLYHCNYDLWCGYCRLTVDRGPSHDTQNCRLGGRPDDGLEHSRNHQRHNHAH